MQQLFQRIPNQGDRLLVAVLVRRLADAKTTQMTIQLPLGLNLTEAVQVKVDGGPPSASRSRPAPISAASCR